MKRLRIVLFTSVTTYLGACSVDQPTGDLSRIDPPVAEKIPHTLTAHGMTRVDNYHWMRLSEEQKNAVGKDEQTQKVFDYLEAENEYLRAKLRHTEPLQDVLYSEIVGRIKQDDASVPYQDNGYWYYTRYEAGKEYPVYCRRQGSMEAPEEILLNVNEMATGYSYIQVRGLQVSEDNNLLAYGVDTVSRRRYTLYVKDLRSGQIIDQPVANTEGYVVWANDNKTFFYSKKDPVTLRSDKIYRHRIGTNPSDDPVVYQEKDPTFYTGIRKTKSDQYLVIWSGSTLTNDYRILDADTPDGTFRPFSPREHGLEYTIDHYGDRFYMVTNLDAPNFRLMETPVTRTARPHWQEKIPERRDTLLEGIEIFRDYLVLVERAHANTHVRIVHQQTGEKHYMKFDEPAYTVSPSVNLDFDTERFRYRYASLTTPNSTYEYDMDARSTELLKRDEVVGGHNPDAYRSKRLWVTARDGVRIPVSLVYRKDTELNGDTPTLLYAYGSYGYSTNAAFSIPRLSLLDRGFVFVIAHVRGGQEMGRQWYETGKMFHKKNTFTDFVDCAQFLIDEGYTSSDKLFAMGGSAGGLLMGAVVNMAPQLFKGVIAHVPFVDIVTTMLDDSIPLTTGEFDEWGNPDSLQSYQYMLSYSPYDQVKAQDYPHMLVTTGIHDSQVQYWEPAKWVAKLREMKTDDNLLLLRTNMETGHSGASGRFRVYHEVAQEYAFLLDLARLRE